MKNTVAYEIKGLKTALREKIRELIGLDEEQTKEQALLNKRLDNLKEILHNAVQRALHVIQKKVKKIIDPLSHLSKQIESIEKRLEDQQRQWEDVQKTKISAKAQAMVELGKIQEEIDAMKPKQERVVKMRELFQFDSEEIFLTILKLVRVKGKQEDQQNREDYLLFDEGRFEIKSGKREEIVFDRDIPDYSARFQIN